MTRVQRSDDPALGMRAVWLGPKGMRWPFDATFAQWRVAAALSFVLVVALWLILPAAIPAVGAAWAAAAVPGRMLFPSHRRAATGALAAAWGLLAVLIVPAPMAWLTPMPLLVAAFAGPALAIAVTWKVGHYITRERPTAYWLALPGRVAAGPRPFKEVERGVKK